jgi:hypothetical protein
MLTIWFVIIVLWEVTVEEASVDESDSVAELASVDIPSVMDADECVWLVFWIPKVVGITLDPVSTIVSKVK